MTREVPGCLGVCLRICVAGLPADRTGGQEATTSWTAASTRLWQSPLNPEKPPSPWVPPGAGWVGQHFHSRPRPYFLFADSLLEATRQRRVSPTLRRHKPHRPRSPTVLARAPPTPARHACKRPQPHSTTPSPPKLDWAREQRFSGLLAVLVTDSHPHTRRFMSKPVARMPLLDTRRCVVRRVRSANFALFAALLCVQSRRSMATPW